MQVSIYSRQAIETLINGDFPKNSAVISFLDPSDNYHNKNSAPVDYKIRQSEYFMLPYMILIYPFCLNLI